MSIEGSREKHLGICRGYDSNRQGERRKYPPGLCSPWLTSSDYQAERSRHLGIMGAWVLVVVCGSELIFLASQLRVGNTTWHIYYFPLNVFSGYMPFLSIYSNCLVAFKFLMWMLLLSWKNTIKTLALKSKSRASFFNRLYLSPGKMFW